MEFNGPLFDERAAIIAEQMRTAVERDVSDEAKNRVVGRLVQVIRQPTPYYWTQIETLHRRGGTEVTGESVIYHWWLEGVGSRNYPVTSFKGYHTFSHVTGVIRTLADRLAYDASLPYLDKLG